MPRPSPWSSRLKYFPSLLVRKRPVDNANDYHDWNFHPCPQRSYVAELRADF